MNNHTFGMRKAFWLCAIFFFGLTISCRKQDSDLGLNVVPQDDQLSVNQSDTLSLITYSVLADSVRTDELDNNNLLGSYVDPYFGSVKSSIYTQIRLDGSVDFTPDGGTISNLVIDSVLMHLKINDLYGNIDAQNFEVFQLTEDMEIDSAYYSNRDFTTNTTNLVLPGSETITPDVVNPGVIDGEILDFPVLQIPLDPNTFALPIMNESGTGTLTANDGAGGFVEWFKGLKITVNNNQTVNQGGITYLDLEDPDSKITIYYRDTINQDTIQFDFNINDNCARTSRFEFDRTGTPLESALLDTTKGQDLFYLQTMGGCNAKISMPNLENYNTGNKIVNRAELVLPAQFYPTEVYLPATQIFLLRTDSTGKELFTPDFVTGGAVIYDFSSNTYRFEMTRYVNQVLSGEIEHSDLTVIANGLGVTANRVVFNGFESSLKDKPRFIITFSEY